MKRNRPPSGQTTAVLLVLAQAPTNWHYGYDLCQQTGLKASGSYRLATTNATQGTTVRVVLSGQIGDGDVLEFSVPDISKLGNYAVTVEQAAARGTYALLDPTGYNISLRVK